MNRGSIQADFSHPELADDLNLLLGVLPSDIHASILEAGTLTDLVEIVMDLGRSPEARFYDCSVYLDRIEVTRDHIDHVVSGVGDFSGDNRAGIERTLHRISGIRNRRGEIIGLTCRVGRAVTGTVDIIRDVVESGHSLLLLGPPGVGKTTLLREAARVLADDLGKRVVVVDTSNEIGGDGDVPHSGIGRARRMQVPSPDDQHSVMIEAVENHMPEVIVIDEIGTLAESLAARTIAERGVQLIGTAHGITLDNLVSNPTLSDLIGGIQAVTLSDEEARRRRTQKTVLERKAPPTFDTLVEIQTRDRLAVYSELARVVDRLLTGMGLNPEVRQRASDGSVVIEGARARQKSFEDFERPREREVGRNPSLPAPPRSTQGRPRIYPIGVNRTRLDRAIRELGVPARIADQPMNADIILSLKAQRKRQPKKLQQALAEGVEFFTIKSNTYLQVRAFLSGYFGGEPSQRSRHDSYRHSGMHEVEDAIVQVQRGGESIELTPQSSAVRRLQHQLIERHGLASESRGRPPHRRVVILPGDGLVGLVASEG